MTSLREQLEAKSRRTGTIPIQVGDLAAAAAEVATFRGALRAHQHMLAAKREQGIDPTEADTQREEQMRANLKSALERQAATVVQVQVQALPDDEFDAVFGDIEPGEDGDLDLDACRAVFLAASCVDEELRDAAWWEQQLKRPEWSKGDLIAVDKYLLDLNLATPIGTAGKG